MNQRRRPDLYLPLRAVYFDAINLGEKVEEYRLNVPFWRARLMGRTFRFIVLTRGYPAGGGIEGKTRITLPWRGYEMKEITHPHFGPDPVQVFAIRVER